MKQNCTEKKINLLKELNENKFINHVRLNLELKLDLKVDQDNLFVNFAVYLVHSR